MIGTIKNKSQGIFNNYQKINLKGSRKKASIKTIKPLTLDK